MDVAPFLLIVLGLFHSTHSYPFYADKIPNGHNVVHPCSSDDKWIGVGHVSYLGGGPRNKFGEDFALAGRMWTQNLCQQDSDNDGRSNGVELGDPDCVWTEGLTPAEPATSHPGVCEPVDSPVCREQSGFSCDIAVGFDCPAINDPAIKSFDLVLPRTTVPAKETNYMCKNYLIPVDQSVHVIATQPIIDNRNVLHHILLFGCLADVDANEELKECGMAPSACRTLLDAWTVGVEGRCVHPDSGVSMGPDTYKYVSMQVHWNNPQLADDFTDASGLRLFYTETLRPSSTQIASFGQLKLNIPPQQEEVTATGVCKSECTRGFPNPVNITTALVHMHYLGVSGKIEVFRDGQLADVFVDDGAYEYETPLMYEFDPPKVIYPGDEIRIHCRYNSRDEPRSRADTTYFGQATDDEMCFAFLTYFPAPEKPSNSFKCHQVGEIDTCMMANNPQECDVCFAYTMLFDINNYLQESGTCTESCTDECMEQVKIGARFPCVMQVAQKIIARGVYPEEFSNIFQAMAMCGILPSSNPSGNTKHQPRSFLPLAIHGVPMMQRTRHMIQFDAANDADLPPFESCGLDIGSTAPGFNRLVECTVVLLIGAILSCLTTINS